MFDNIGSKVMRLATVSVIVGIIASVLSAIVEWAAGLILAGFLTLILGCLGSWIGSWALYAIGYTADNSKRNQADIAELKATLSRIQGSAAAGMPDTHRNASESGTSAFYSARKPATINASSSAGESKPVSAAKPASSAPSSPSGGLKKCPSCGTMLWSTRTECYACNAKLSE